MKILVAYMMQVWTIKYEVINLQKKTITSIIMKRFSNTIKCEATNMSASNEDKTMRTGKQKNKL